MKSKIGIGLIILSFIICLNPYFLIFGIPTFLVGSLILFRSNKNLKSKLLWFFTPLIIWYPIMNLFIFITGIIGTATAQKLDFIFPENFKGKAIIVSNMPCGQEVEFYKNREQIKIPESGILLYQGELKYGYINHKYYSIDKNGKKSELLALYNYMFWDDYENPPKTEKFGVWSGGGGQKYFNNSNEIMYSYSEFILSSKDSLNKLNDFKKNNEFEKKIDSLVLNCMKKN